jgi:hypothetical protein
MTINPVIQFIMDELHGDATLVSITDNQYYTGLLREPVSLTPPYYTRIGIEYISDSGPGHFFTNVRDWSDKHVQVKITVVTSYGHNDNHCRTIVEAISSLFVLHRKKTSATYKIYIDGFNTTIAETEEAKWIGTITLDVSYLTPVSSSVT